MIKRLKKEDSGYSMVEVLAAIVILSVAILPMVGMFDAGLRAAVLGGNYDQGRSLANEKLEEVKALPYNEATTKYDPALDQSVDPFTGSEGDFDYEIDTFYVDSDLDPAPDARTRMQVEVTVEWNDGGTDYTTSGLMTASAP